MTKTLAKEWGRYNVSVNAVAFGWILTRLTDADGSTGTSTISIDGRELRVGMSPELIEAAKKSIPLGRPGMPQEGAGAVYLLCQPESNYITGQCLVCDGGGLA